MKVPNVGEWVEVTMIVGAYFYVIYGVPQRNFVIFYYYFKTRKSLNSMVKYLNKKHVFWSRYKGTL